jgi:hypothetical protein
VDEVTQWEIVASVERISEAYLVLALESMLAEFPFVIRGFHRKLHWIPASLLAGGKWLAVRRGKGACLNRAFSCITASWGLEGLNMPYMI